ncbi:SGNH/GDSL hydrolase family protein [Streptomyces sp. NPDC088789]|uniref:SGNH/GDSL hydrolase family protein n=1 Tax=Streptomyces sp. NPDC088789 TaxID=3365899 RepID=UPI00381D3A3C
MRRTRGRWTVGVLAGALLLGACGDPEGDAGSATSTPYAPSPSPGSRSPGLSASAPASPGPSVSASSSPAPSASASRKAPTVLYLGDSLAMENQKVLGEELRRELGARYTGAPYSGTTLCDYLEGTDERSLVPDEDKAAALVREVRPDVVVLQFWGNAWGYTPCMDGITYDTSRARYFDRYASDARALTGQIAAAGGDRRPTVVWVLQGPDPITPDRVRRVNALYREQAAAASDAVADAGGVVSPAGDRHTWVRELPCTTYERTRPGHCTDPARGRTALHREDDYLHFCLAPTTSEPKPCPVRSPGILRMVREITRAVGALR